MKHSLKITLILIFSFFIAQLIGLAVTNAYLDHETSIELGTATYLPGPPGFEERPPVQGASAVLTIALAIGIGTLLVFLLMKIKRFNFFKVWFLLAVGVTLYWAFSGFINYQIAAVLAIALAIYKVYRPNVFIQNITELFIYGGLAAIIVPILGNIFWGFALLILISVYDMYAVWKSKHMIKLAKLQIDSKVFAGLLIPYQRFKKPKGNVKLKKVNIKTAVLGGGDIGFPLIFAGLAMQDLMLQNTQAIGFLKALIIPVFTTIALAFLLTKGKKDRFYPAMPYLTAGCVAGYLVLLLINLI